MRQTARMSVPPAAGAAPESALLGASAALALVAVSGVWRTAPRYLVTVAHEGGHALVAALLGRGVRSITIDEGSGGETRYGSGSRLGNALVLIAGYTAPSLLGLGGAALIASGRSAAALLVALVGLLLALVKVRNLFGWVVVAAAVALIGWLALRADPLVQDAAASAVVFVLIFGGMRDAHELQGIRRRDRSRRSDADALRRLTWIPGLVWVAVFWVVGAMAVLGAAGVLLGVDLAPLAGAAQRLQP
jgi:hypothetical protein